MFRAQNAETRDKRRIHQMKKLTVLLLWAFPFMVVLFATVNPPRVMAVPSFARQTGLPCSGCHYTPPELNPAGRRFKLLGYVDRADETKTVKADGGKKRAALDLLASLPLSVMLDTSFTSTQPPIPTTQNGSFELPQDISLFLSGAWTTHIVQVNDQQGAAVVGALVEFAAAPGVTFNPASALTDSSGQVTTNIALGGMAGRYQLTATTTDKSHKRDDVTLE